MKSYLKMLLVAGVFALSLAVFQEDASADTQLASWYGPGLEGNLTASGDIFEPYEEYTAASLYYPFGTELLVTYGGYSVVVEVTDRGPYVAGRELDLSAAAAEEIGLTYTGIDYVDVQVIY
ncbi:MAG: septal ring lytic transglycosylase RlpA family protein [Actinomycetota bacterium]|jgi:rare lipoprotein A|nr:septal ring lytic transglycosylase RlpA family protein [Actinomycetota bacterium]MDP9477099.1 septal ring lytic transglycosylase RlpA family protein [Actinomycetota bacterium]